MNQVIDVKIENMIYEVRGKQVMLDSDLARLFGYETKDLNRNVKNNINRFPEGYCFQLTNVEYESLRCKNITLKNGRGQHKKYLPYVFTEYGITMLTGILRSDIAIKMSLRIVDTFIAMKKYISSNLVNQNYYNEMVIKHDNEIKLLQESFEQLQNNKTNNGLFFEGQIYDAYSLLLDIFEQSKESIIVIDNYIDKKILDVLRNTKKEILIITNKYNNKDLDKY